MVVVGPAVFCLSVFFLLLLSFLALQSPCLLSPLGLRVSKVELKSLRGSTCSLCLQARYGSLVGVKAK